MTDPGKVTAREFVTESLAPLCGVCGAILGLTVLLFDVPERPEPAPSAMVAATTSAEPATSVSAVPPVAEVPPRQAEQINDIFARAMRQLAAVRAPLPPRPQPPTGSVVHEAPLPTSEAADPGLLQAVSALGDAIKAIHEARTEEDIVHAEERMRSAREQMEATCSGSAPGNPLCQSAAQIKDLGY